METRLRLLALRSVTTVEGSESGRAAVLSFHSAAVPTLAPVPQELQER